MQGIVHVRQGKIFGLCGVVLLPGRSFLHRYRATRRAAIFFAADSNHNRSVVADSIFFGRKIIFTSAFAEFIDRRRVARDVPAAVHVDLSAAVVHVADLLRFRGRNGDFYFFDKRDDNFPFAADNLRFEFIFPDNSAGRADLLLHDVALFIAGVAHGDLLDELARGGRIYPRNDWFTDCCADFIFNWIFFAADL